MKSTQSLSDARNEIIRVGLVDDHSLFCGALSCVINGFGGFDVAFTASNGREMMERIGSGINIIILDLNMPVMNGYETAVWLRENHPDIALIILTMYDSEAMMIRLLRLGAKAYLKKHIHPDELRHAMESVIRNGECFTGFLPSKLITRFKNKIDIVDLEKSMFSEQQFEFLQLACSDLTYKEIAHKMSMHPRAIDNMRDILFTKLDVKSRSGLVIYAVKNGIVML